MMQKFPRYQGGYILKLFKEAEVRNVFGARINEGAEIDVATLVPFSESTRRQSDLEFAEQLGFSLSRKVKIPRCKALDELNVKYKCIIDKYLYDVSYIDYTDTENYLYLELIREV